MSRQVRWLTEMAPGDPEHNMALDASLLAEQVNQADCLPLIRLYEWDRPAVSIGRLQQEEPVGQLYPGLPCVRRPTGGRAVLHGSDLTLSVVMQVEWLLNGRDTTVLSSYRMILEGVILALRTTGHDVSFGAEKPSSNRNIIDCFGVAAGCDLIDTMSRKKIVGCAQRREGSAILQQMSLPLNFLRDKSAFLVALPQGFQDALNIDNWLF